MQRIVFVYGALAGAIVIATIIAGIAVSEDGEMPHARSVWLGYLIMLVALSLVFVGIRQYRDRHLGGVIRFRTAMLVGLGISAVAGVVYTVGWETWLALSDQDFIAGYAEAEIEARRAQGASDAELQAVTEKLDDLVESYRNPWFRLPMTFLEIFPVGALVTLVSAAILRNPRARTAT